jgi:cytochrome oxidase Cu insertion factor (SCO1/SenC/PrrC family)
MPGMNSGLNVNAPVIVAAFRSALFHQGLVAIAIFLLVSLVWAGLRGRRPAQQSAAAGLAEPAGRRLLRIGFGVLWLFDGWLQAQPAMAVGLPSRVIAPTAVHSPAWVRHLVNWGGTTWSYHPVQAGAAAVWIQVGLGIWLLAAGAGPSSRLAGLASTGWGLVVWVFGESFGGIFAPGLSWLFGAPGAALFYCAAGVLVALPSRYWCSARLGRVVLAAIGVFLVAMAVLQAWPGRGFWHGLSGGQPATMPGMAPAAVRVPLGTLAAMTASMAKTPQPGFLSSWIAAFTGFDEAHGFAVNLFVVTALAVTGAGLLTGRPRVLRPVMAFLTVLCLADWVLVQDLGFLGGLGTDPNSMIPLLLVAAGGYVALVRVPATAGQRDTAPGQRDTVPAPRWRERLRPGTLRSVTGAVSGRTVTSVAAVGVIILGAVPMAAAQASRTADPILAKAIAGSAAPLNHPAPAFALTDQHGHPVSLASLRGKVVLLTFLDPVGTTGSPLIAQEFRAAGQLLGAHEHQVELVAIALSPTYHTVAVTCAFDRQERMNAVPNWLFLTGSVAQLRQVWRAYGVTAYSRPAGAMTAHANQAYVIGPAGHVLRELSTAPGPGTAATKASFAALLAGAAQQALASP